MLSVLFVFVWWIGLVCLATTGALLLVATGAWLVELHDDRDRRIHISECVQADDVEWTRDLDLFAEWTAAR